MAGSIVPIKPGPATKISGSNLHDTTIYNTSSTQAIWISNVQNTSPNNGMRVGPLGTARWAKDAGLAWACVDIGVITPINLNVSNDLVDPTNPVDVATAVATALLAQGIPNVLTTELLFNGSLGNPASQTFDVSGYASLILGLTGNNLTDDLVMQVQMNDPVAGLASDIFLLSTPSLDPLVGALASWKIPVTHPEIKLIPYATASGVDMNVYLSGSNRPVPKLSQMVLNTMPVRLRYTGAFGAVGTFHQLTSIDNTNDNATRFNGPCTMVCSGNSAALTAGFTVTCNWVGIAGGGLPVRNQLLLYPGITASKQFADFMHPPVPCSWSVQTLAAAAAAQVDLRFSPAGAGL